MQSQKCGQWETNSANIFTYTGIFPRWAKLSPMSHKTAIN